MSAKREVDKIWEGARKRAMVLLDEEAKKLFAAQPKKYGRFVMAAGWGNTLFDPAGKMIRDEERLSAQAQKFMELADHCAELFVADNHEVVT